MVCNTTEASDQKTKLKLYRKKSKFARACTMWRLASDTAPFVVFYERVISPLHARSTELSRYLFSVRSSWASHHVHKNCARRCTPSMGVCYIDSNGEKPRLWLCLPRQSQEAESNEACTRDIGSTAKALCKYLSHTHTHVRAQRTPIGRRFICAVDLFSLLC